MWHKVADKKKEKDIHKNREVGFPGLRSGTKIFKGVYSGIHFSNAAVRVFYLRPEIQWGSFRRNIKLLSF